MKPCILYTEDRLTEGSAWILSSLISASVVSVAGKSESDLSPPYGVISMHERGKKGKMWFNRTTLPLVFHRKMFFFFELLILIWFILATKSVHSIPSAIKFQITCLCSYWVRTKVQPIGVYFSIEFIPYCRWNHHQNSESWEDKLVHNDLNSVKISLFPWTQTTQTLPINIKLCNASRCSFYLFIFPWELGMTFS